MSFKYHGNWCGPGWSDGKWQTSVKDGSLKPIDQLDYLCKLHDQAYANAKGNYEKESEADLKFARTAVYSSSVKQALAKIGLSIQGLVKQQIYKHLLIKETDGASKTPTFRQVKQVTHSTGMDELDSTNKKQKITSR